MTTRKRSQVQQRQALESPLAYLSYLVAGIYFGFILIKTQVVSWYRIQEMFQFQSFYMYGVIGSAVIVGMISVALIKYYKLKTLAGQDITFAPKARQYRANLLGGSIFGLGWAMTGACPGPIYALVGSGLSVFGVVFISALLGTWVYGWLRPHLPH